MMGAEEKAEFCVTMYQNQLGAEEEVLCVSKARTLLRAR